MRGAQFFCVEEVLGIFMVSFRQGVHEGTELIAAIGVTLEHVEGGSAGRKEDDFARLRDRVRALDRIGQRVARSRIGTASLQSSRNAFRHFADQNRGAHLFLQRAARSDSKVNPLSFPPAIRTTGLVCASSAFSTASRLVAFESLM